MDYFAGLDVSVKDTNVCIVDEVGKIVREVKVASEPDALLAVLRNPAYHFKRIGLEAGPLSQWLFSALAEAELPVVCVETRHMQAVLKAQINKTDRNDVRGIAQMMRVGLYRPVHVKTLRSQKLRMLLTHRKLLQSKAIAIENDLRGTLRNFGLKVGMVGKVKFETRIKELVENLPDLAILVEPLLIVRRTLREQIVILHHRLLAIVRDDEVCRRPSCGSTIPRLVIRGVTGRQRWYAKRSKPAASATPGARNFPRIGFLADGYRIRISWRRWAAGSIPPTGKCAIGRRPTITGRSSRAKCLQRE